LTHTKSGWTKKTLYNFTGKDDGELPEAGLVADKAGNLYGAANGGLNKDGVIFEMSPGSGGGWKYKVIHSFDGSDGGGPEGSLIFDDAGNLYGPTAGGGPYKCFSSTCGTVFELSPSKTGWKLTTLHDFDGGDGSFPWSALYRDRKGNLYGTAESGGYGGCLWQGSDGCGTVFELSPSGKRWQFAVIHRFAGPDGDGPTGQLATDEKGSLYGTATGGGLGSGVAYRLTPRNGTWKETVLHEFGGGRDGQGPKGGVTFGSNGNLYGTTVQGGEFGDGALFELEPSGRGWKESVPFSFNGEDGYVPQSALARGGGSGLFGTTQLGGNGECSGGCGVVFEFVL
jgi:uncharacterized repeat protein (TIGR03803 family)